MNDFTGQLHTVYPDADLCDEINDALASLPTEKLVDAINARPSDYLGIQYIHAPFPGVRPSMLDNPSELKQYIDHFDKLREWNTLYSFVQNDNALLERVKNKMTDYVISKHFKHDLAKIRTLKNDHTEPVLVGGNMVERVLPLAYLYGLPVYQAPAVDGNWQDLTTQLKELGRNLNTLEFLAKASAKEIAFVWIGMDLSRESRRLHDQSRHFLPIRFAAKEAQLIQKLTNYGNTRVHFEPMVRLPRNADSCNVVQGVAGFDFREKRLSTDSKPTHVLDFKKLQNKLGYKLSLEEITYLYSTGHWHHVDTRKLHTPKQGLLLESIKEAILFFRSKHGYCIHDLVASARKVRTFS